MSSNNFQIQIDQTPSGETLNLSPGEYQGPLLVNKPITLEGCVQDGKIRTTIWSQQGPVIIITADDVKFLNLNVEVTMQNGDTDKDADVAIKSEPGVQVELENVTVRGRLVGLNGEAGDWLLPRSLDLGTLAARKLNRYKLRIFVPVPCQVSTKVSGLTIKPVNLQQGLNDVSLEVRDICKDCFISGTILVRSAFVNRSIELTGRTPSTEDIEPIADVLIWEPKDVPPPEPVTNVLPDIVIEVPPIVEPTPVPPPNDDPPVSPVPNPVDTPEDIDSGIIIEPGPPVNVPTSLPVVEPKPQPEPIDPQNDSPTSIKPRSVYVDTGGKISDVFQSPTSIPVKNPEEKSDSDNVEAVKVSDVFGGDKLKAENRNKTPSKPITHSIPNPSVFASPDGKTTSETTPSNDEVKPTNSSPTGSRRTKTSGVSQIFSGNSQPTEKEKPDSSESVSPQNAIECNRNDQESETQSELPKQDEEPSKEYKAKKSLPDLGGAFK